jgi:hypothetical protein
MIEMFVMGLSAYFVCQPLHIKWRLFEKYILEFRVRFVRNRNHGNYTISDQSLFQINDMYCYS